MANKTAQKPKTNTANKKPAAKKGEATKNIHPSTTKVDEKTRFKGTVLRYNKQGGYGFVKPEKSGVVPGDEVMVYWKEIKSTDRWPFLYKDLDVEFNLAKYEKANGSGCIIKGTEVTLPGKKAVNLQDELEDKKEYIHSKATRFSGVVKYYNAAEGYGSVTLDEGYAGVEDVPAEALRVVRAEINSGSEAPCLRKDLKIEFGIQKNLKGNYSCYNVTLPGGDSLERNVVEERKEEGKTTYNGEVSFFSVQKGYGYIKPDSISKFPAKCKKALEEDAAASKAKLEKKGQDKKSTALEPLVYFRRGDMSENFVKRGTKVSFRLYQDIRGVGALAVTAA